MKPLNASNVADTILRDALERYCRCFRLARRARALAEAEPSLVKFHQAAEWALGDAEREVVHAIYLRDPAATELGLMAPELPSRGVRFGKWLFIAADDETLTVVRVKRIEDVASGGPPAMKRPAVVPEGGGSHVCP